MTLKMPSVYDTTKGHTRRVKPVVLENGPDDSAYVGYSIPIRVVYRGDLDVTILARTLPTGYSGTAFPVDTSAKHHVLVVDQDGTFLIAEQSQLADMDASGTTFYPTHIATYKGWVRWTPRKSNFVAPTSRYVLLSGNDNLNDPSYAITDTYLNRYGTKASPTLAFPAPDAGDPAVTTTGATQTYVTGYTVDPVTSGVTNNRLAASGDGNTLTIAPDATLWFSSQAEDSATATQVSIDEFATISGINAHQVLGVNYNRTTQRWWILYQSVAYDATGGPINRSSVVDRSVASLYYDEVALGILDPTNGAGWLVGKVWMDGATFIPGWTGTPPALLDGYNGITGLDGVLDNLYITNTGTVDPGGGGSPISVSAPQVLDITSYLVAAPLATVRFNVTCDASGILAINGAGTVVYKVVLQSGFGELFATVAQDPHITAVTNRPDNPDDPAGPFPPGGGGGYWVYGAAHYDPILSRCNFLDFLSDTTFKIANAGSDIGLGGMFHWADSSNPAGGYFPPSATGFLCLENFHSTGWGPPYETFLSASPFRTDDIQTSGDIIALPAAMGDALYKYWTYLNVSVGAAPSHLSGPTFTASFRSVEFTMPGIPPTVPMVWWATPTGTYDPTPVVSGFSIQTNPNTIKQQQNAGTYHGSWGGIGENGEVIGFQPGDFLLTYSTLTEDKIVTPDQTLSYFTNPNYSRVGFCPGAEAPFLAANGTLLDNDGVEIETLAIHGLNRRGACGDNAGGLYAILDNDLWHRPGPFGTAWSMVAAGFATMESTFADHNTVILLRKMEDGTILLIEGDAGTVQTAIWTGSTVIRPSSSTFDTDQYYKFIGDPIYQFYSSFVSAAIAGT